MKRLIVATILCVASVGYAGYGEVTNKKAHCVLLKQDKVIHQQACRYDQTGMGNIWGEATDTKIKKIKGYGSFDIIYSASSLVVNDNVVFDSNNQPVTAEEELNLNGKPAHQRYRMPKTFQELTQTQAARYEEDRLKDKNGKPIVPYACYYYGSGKGVEICYK